MEGGGLKRLLKRNWKWESDSETLLRFIFSAIILCLLKAEEDLSGLVQTCLKLVQYIKILRANFFFKVYFNERPKQHF